MTETPIGDTHPADPALDPQSFDLDAWLNDAALPQRSVKVYKRADLLAEMDELERLIDINDRAEQIEESVSSGSGNARLVTRYQSLAEQFAASALTVTVRGLLKDEMDSIRDRAEKNKWPANLTGKHFIAKALVFPTLPIEGVNKLEKAIGSAQIGLIARAVAAASDNAPEVNAHFLQRFSGQDATQE